MLVGWESYRGAQRRTNNDAAAVGYAGKQVLAMLVDAAERGLPRENGQGLARHWAKTIVSRAIQGELPITTAGLVALMREEQRQLRHRYLLEIASFCLALIDQPSRQIQLLAIGDCLAGIRSKEGEIKWLHGPHNLISQEGQVITLAQAADTGQRHLLTRSLNAKRFKAPDCCHSILPQGADLLIASDGYWYECLQQGIPFGQVSDDASLLTLTAEEGSPHQVADCQNLFVIQRCA